MALILREEENDRADYRSSSGKSCFVFFLFLSLTAWFSWQQHLCYWLNPTCIPVLSNRKDIVLRQRQVSLPYLYNWMSGLSKPVCLRGMCVCERERKKERERVKPQLHWYCCCDLWTTFPLSPPIFVLSKRLKQYRLAEYTSTHQIFFGISFS